MPTWALVSALQNWGTSKVLQTMTYLHKDPNPLMKLALLLSVFCLVFPKRTLLTREFKAMLRTHEREGLNHLDSPLLLIKEMSKQDRYGFLIMSP